MEITTELIRSITEFMQYFAPGFIFLGCKNYASCKKREEKTEYLVASSIAISFAITTVSSFFTRLVSYNYEKVYLFSDIWITVRSFIAIALAIISGLAMGRFIRTRQANYLSQILFRRDFRSDFFVFLKDEMTEKSCTLLVRLKRKNDLYYYVGQIERVLNPEDKPILILYNYASYNEKGRRISHRDGEYRLLIHYGDIESFEYIKIKKTTRDSTGESMGNSTKAIEIDKSPQVVC